MVAYFSLVIYYSIRKWRVSKEKKIIKNKKNDIEEANNIVEHENKIKEDEEKVESLGQCVGASTCILFVIFVALPILFILLFIFTWKGD